MSLLQGDPKVTVAGRPAGCVEPLQEVLSQVFEHIFEAHLSCSRRRSSCLGNVSLLQVLWSA
jgi:hypothetical protein